MTLRFGRNLLAATLAFGVAVAASPAALAAEQVRYHEGNFETGAAMDSVRELFRQARGIDPGTTVPVGLGDIDMDGQPEFFLTDIQGIAVTLAV